jgi:hypothetical protein
MTAWASISSRKRDPGGRRGFHHEAPDQRAALQTVKTALGLAPPAREGRAAAARRALLDAPHDFDIAGENPKLLRVLELA